MKKINLIEWLWKTDSHEKQKPQRFARYAVMLLLLLTCVTHAWAGTKKVYVNIQDHTGYKENGKNIEVHYWGGSSDNYAIANATSTSNLFCAEVPDDATHLQVCRANENNRSERYNYQNETSNTSHNVYNVTGWDNSGSWYAMKFIPQGKYIYYQYNSNNNWTQSDYNVKYNWKCNSSSLLIKADIVAHTTKITDDGNKYIYCAVPSYDYVGTLQFLRLNPSDNNQWNWANDVAYDGTSNCMYFTSASWDGGSPSWKTYSPPLSAISLSDNGTTNYGGNGSSGNPYLVKVGDDIKVSASATKAINDPDANIYYQFYNSSSTMGSETTTSTYSTTAGSVNTVYTMTVKGRTKIGSTWGTQKSASSSKYYKRVNVYHVTYALGSYTESGSAPSDATHYVYYTGNAPTPTIKDNTGSLYRAGYNFNGWNTAEDGGGTDYAVGATPTLSGDLTLYPKWTKAASYYDVTFGVGTSYTTKGTLSARNTTDDVAISSGDDIAANKEITFTASPNSYYQVEGWYTDAACSSAIGGAAKTNPYVVASLGSDLDVYVAFEPITYNITYHLNGGTGATDDTYTVESSLITLPTAPTVNKTGYTFDGWYDNSGLTGVPVTSIAAGSHGNKEYWAKWTIKSYNITYSPASAPTGATYTTVPSSANYNSTVDMVIAPTADNYVINVTAVDASSNAVTVTPGASNHYTFTMPASNVTVSVSATAMPVVYVMKSKDAGCTVPHGFTATGNDDSRLKLWAYSTASGNPNFYSGAEWQTRPSPDDVYEDGLHNEWYRFIANNVDHFNESTNYQIILLYDGEGDANRIFASNQSNPKSCSDGVNIVTNVTDFSGPVWIIPQGSSGANSAILYTSYPVSVAWSLYSNGSKVDDFTVSGENIYTLKVNISDISDLSRVCFKQGSTNYKLSDCALHTSYTSSGTAATLSQTSGTFSWTGSPSGTWILTIFKESSDWKIYATPTYTVTYQGNGSTSGSVPVDGNSPYTAGADVTVLGNTGSLAKSGYTFDCWNTRADGTGQDYSAGATIDDIDDDVILYAKWYESVDSKWYLIGDPANDWSDVTTHPLDRLFPGETNVYYRIVTLPAVDQYFRFYHKEEYNHAYGNTNITATVGTKYDIIRDNGNSLRYSAGGTVWFVVDEVNNKFWVQAPQVYHTVTFGYGAGCDEFTAQDGDENDLVSGKVYPEGTALTFTQTTKTGYSFDGWNTAPDGSGTSLGSGSSYSTTLTADVSVYACYTENEYNTTVSAGTGGSVSPSGTVAIKQVSGTSITATPNSGYHFLDWTISGGGITPTTSSSATQTFTATSTGGSITANFAEDTYTVSVTRNKEYLGSVSTSSVSGIGITTASGDITATPVTGANFVNWTIPAGVSLAAGYANTDATIRIKATASGKTITANFTEPTYTANITTENSSKGTVTPASVTTGQITPVQITAEKKTGYMFAGWEIVSGSGNVKYHVSDAPGSTESATGQNDPIAFITIDGNLTLQATWAVDRTSGWSLRGTWQDGAGWGDAADKDFIKDEGEETGTVSHVRWDLAPEMFTDGTMLMKMYEVAADKYYGHMTNFDDAGNLCTKDANNSNLQFYGDDSYQNFKVSIPVAGIYDFEWDSSTKRLTIHYPAGNFIRGGFNSWGWTAPLAPTGNANELACTISMTGDNAPHSFTGDYGFKVMLGGDHYGKDGTTITRAANSAGSLVQGGGSNINLTTDVRGDYTFTVNTNTNTVTITYPTAYTVTYGYGTGGSSVSASANSVAGTFSSGAYVAAGDVVTFSQTPADGYTFKGWYTTADGNESAGVNGSNQLTINATKTVYAQYTPTIYENVALNKTIGLTDGEYSVTFGGTSITVTTLPTKTGYEPEGYYESYANSVWTNLIATSAGSLQNNTTYTDASGHWTSIASPTLYTKWQPKTYDIELNMNGSYASHGTATATFDGVLSVITRPQRTGYHVDGYYKQAGLSDRIANADGSLCASTDYTDGSSHWTHDGAVSLYTKWTANSYSVHFNGNGNNGGEMSDETGFTYDEPKALTNNAFTKTGYHFTGWATSEGGSMVYTDGESVSNLTDVENGTAQLWAVWEANNYTVTLDVDEENKGSIDGATPTVTATYDATMPAIGGTLPIATDGYRYMGMFTEANGEGVALTDSLNGWKDNVDTYISDGKWVRDGGATLYAYYKKAEITALTLDHPTIAPEGTVIATPTISPTPEGDTKLCWKLFRSNGNEVEGTTFTSGSGNSVTFNAPKTSGSYTVEATLRTGSSCDGGTALDTTTTGLVVAGDHKVAIRYQDGDGRTLAASEELISNPLDWSEAINPVEVTGYTFHYWLAGDGITISTNRSTPIGKDTTHTATIYVQANYDGNLTAVYNKKNMIYFNNTLGWSNVHVYFYSTEAYWEENHIEGKGCGTGANQEYSISGQKAFYRGYHGNMTQIEGTNIWYYDYEAAWGDSDGGEIKGYDDVVFVETEQTGYDFFYNNKACRRGDFNHSLPMFVPLTEVTNTKNGTNYYSNGYWMNYPENSGYKLKIYNAWNAAAGSAAREYYFPYSEDKTMPMKLDVEFNNGGSDYWFMVQREDGNYYGKDYTFNQNYNGEQKITKVDNTKSKLVTSAPGIYTLTLTYHKDGSGNVDYYIDVDFPVAVNDYRILYKDQVAWSGAVHDASWGHPSNIINKNSGETTKLDTVSLFVKVDENTSAKFQYASTITDAGVVTWSDVSGGDIDLSVITSDGVYNFIVSQPAGGASISLEKVEPYTGNYYIRTDCAGSTKWDSYTTLDHHMTYSDYAAAGPDDFTHYYCHWVKSGTNIKFTIANDHSVAVSDTLEGDKYTTQSLVANANIRFMYDERTNQIKRAYISGSGTITDRFLVLEGDAKMYDEDGHALTGDYQDHDQYGTKLGTDNQVILHDDENFLYERTIMVNPQARAKLTAKYHDVVQYFKGSDGEFGTETTIQLLGGETSAKKYKMRIVYDFKTNRLVTAYIPEGEISGEVEINADLMLVREHQGEATQLTFADENDILTDVKNVYGVMRFNRWILNNRQHPEDHNKKHSDTDSGPDEARIAEYHPHLDQGSQKSVAERGLYWISFPFDVNLSEVFGFGTYGVHWIMMDYNGAERARIGYWKDSEGFWEYIWDRRGVILEKGKGYVLALDLDLMKENNGSFWNNGIQQVELFFPSTSSNTGDISQQNVNVTVPSHKCEIDLRTDETEPDWNKDRRVADSHWNIIGVPSYANYGKDNDPLTNGTSTITWNSRPMTDDLPFLYEWNSNDNTYTVQDGEGYNFKAMHAYYVQYAGTLHWSLASATPASVARRTYADRPQNVSFKLELAQNDKMIDQTFVKLSNNEEVSAGFSFGEDMNKEFNAGKANIYTFIENYMPAAGNTMPMSEQTTVVPVGVKIATTGDYTFAIPSGTSGVGVTLVDLETGVRTNLALFDYNIALEAGDYTDRFVLEISPIQHTPTGVEDVQGDNVQGTTVRKVLIDNIMYIIRDGKVFDARGAIVK